MDDHALALEINVDLVRRKLIDFLRTEVRRAGFQRAVVGVSGGLDSALACFLAAEALGPKNVLGIRMPFRTSSADSLEHASLVLQQTGVNALTVPITPMAEPFLTSIPEDDPIRRGNVLARLRMIVLYDRSAEFQGLVVGTGNKTEILLGYTTLFGDSACALNPIGDLYKTQVRQLARSMGVPKAILAKPPSADLWAGQTDEGELGFTYERVDQLLMLMVDGRHAPDVCVEAGFDRAFVQAVLDRMRRNRFKRLPPPIALVGDRPADDEHLIPRDGGT
jgi:NAD+ synthase